MKNIARNKGFTLIEILVVIGIIAILAAIVIIAINPARQFAQARDTQRTSNVETILNAIGQNLADNKGVLGAGCPVFVPTTTYTIAAGAAATLVGGASANIDLWNCLTPTYIPSGLPADPNGGVSVGGPGSYNTEYNIMVDSNGRYTVTAPNASAETVISNPAPAVSLTR